MADNTGNYLEYHELIAGMYIGDSTLITSEDTTLSNKVVDAGGDKYDYTGGTPQIGHVVFNNGSAEIIALPAAGKIQINKTGAANTLTLGAAKFLSSVKVPKVIGEQYITEAMAFIDEQTGQFFNKRSGTFKFEGKNTYLLHLPVPIIEIIELLINSTDEALEEGEDKDFYAFKGRSNPNDDRKNPRIKLSIGRGRDSIYTRPLYTHSIFMKDTLTSIEGSFGYLEPDGNTPPLIKKATLLICQGSIEKDTSGGGVTSSTSVGPMKRIKVDLHEKEFFEAGTNKQIGNTKTESGIPEVDEILAKYKSPIRISGSIPFFPARIKEYSLIT